MSFTFHRHYRGPLQAAVFDWAGTTCDYGCCAPAVVFVDVFARKGVAIAMDEARGPMGANKRTHVEEITLVPRVAALWREVHDRPCTQADIDAMYADFIPLQLACLRDYADLIPGTIETAADLRRRGMKIGSTTGYSSEMMDILVPEAKGRGYAPDSTVSASDVPAGRPAPWMALRSAMDLGVYPMEAVVKVGDTVPDIAEGLNAGMWTVGVTKTGNEVGLTEAEIAALAPGQLAVRMKKADERLTQAGAHYVIDGIADLPPVIDDINIRLARGERP